MSVLGVLGGGELAGDICAGLSLGLNNWWGPLSCYSADCWVLSLMQDEEHIILDCPSEDLAGLRAQFQHLFSALPENGATRLRDFMNQTDVLELAKFVCLLKMLRLILSFHFFLVWSDYRPLCFR